MKIDNNVLVTSICNINITVSLLTVFEPPKDLISIAVPITFLKFVFMSHLPLKEKRAEL